MAAILTLLVRMKSGATTLENSLAVFYEVKYVLII